MSPWNDEKHKAVRARCEAATEGPWRWSNTGGTRPRLAQKDNALVMGFARQGFDGAQPVLRTSEGTPEKAGRGNLYNYPDAAFIAHARADLAAALDEIERLRALVTVTDDKVKRAADAAYENLANQDPRWNEVHGDTEFATIDGSFHFLDTIRAALEAALNPGEDR